MIKKFLIFEAVSSLLSLVVMASCYFYFDFSSCNVDGENAEGVAYEIIGVCRVLDKDA